ncbi:MAG: hypothetical protein OXE52_16315 [Chloroflexi bacterium]|nr:hypothetical protein [Chloroflexota bacterium]
MEYNDNRKASQGLIDPPSRLKIAKPRQAHPVVMDHSPPEPPLEVIVNQERPLTVYVAGDKTRLPGDVLWAIALSGAILGLVLILILPSPSIYHQIFWALALLTLVVAIRR